MRSLNWNKINIHLSFSCILLFFQFSVLGIDDFKFDFICFLVLKYILNIYGIDIN